MPDDESTSTLCVYREDFCEFSIFNVCSLRISLSFEFNDARRHKKRNAQILLVLFLCGCESSEEFIGISKQTEEN